MNKILYQLKLSIGKKQIVYCSFSVAAIFILARLKYFLDNSFMKEQNWFDFLISIFSNYLVMAYFIFALFIFFIYNIGFKNLFYQNLIIKFKNRRIWYNHKIIELLAISLIFTLILILICFLVGISSLVFTNRWSSYTLFLASNKSITKVYDVDVLSFIIDTLSPMVYIFINILYAICFFFVLEIIYLIFSMCFKKTSWAFLSVIIVNLINIALYSSDKFCLSKISFYYNIILLSPTEDTVNCSLIYTRFLYWIIYICILYFLGGIICSKIDFKFGDNS